VQDFRQLAVWERSLKLTLSIYLETRSFPRDEMFGLTSQIRRSCSSIGANIAEGCGRGSDQDFARFLQIAMGSASELESHLVLAQRLDFLKPEQHRRLEIEVQGIKKMLAKLLIKVRGTNKTDSR
jgi:four helix bundle protein